MMRFEAAKDIAWMGQSFLSVKAMKMYNVICTYTVLFIRLGTLKNYILFHSGMYTVSKHFC